MRKKIWLSSLTVMLTCLMLSGRANATFVCTPMEFHIDVASGKEATYTFFVKNRGEETIALKVYAGDFWIKPDGNEVFLEPGEVERSCAPWLELAPEELELAADESQAVRFKITVPEGKSGAYWAMVFVEQITKPTIKTAERGESQFNILSFQRVGVRVFENTPEAKIGGCKITQVDVGWNTEERAYKIDLIFENDGETLLNCNGEVEIKDERGQTVASIETGEFRSYPEAVRTVGTLLKEKLAPGQYSALAIVDFGAEHLVAGEAIFEVKGEPR